MPARGAGGGEGGGGGSLASLRAGAPRPPCWRPQEREAEGRLFRGYFERARGRLYEDSTGAEPVPGAAAGAGGGARWWLAVVAWLRAALAWLLRSVGLGGKAHLA